MEALDDILRDYTVSDCSTNTEGKLLGASFVVLKDNGPLSLAQLLASGPDLDRCAYCISMT